MKALRKTTSGVGHVTYTKPEKIDFDVVE